MTRDRLLLAIAVGCVVAVAAASAYFLLIYRPPADPDDFVGYWEAAGIERDIKGGDLDPSLARGSVPPHLIRIERDGDRFTISGESVVDPAYTDVRFDDGELVAHSGGPSGMVDITYRLWLDDGRLIMGNENDAPDGVIAIRLTYERAEGDPGELAARLAAEQTQGWPDEGEGSAARVANGDNTAIEDPRRAVRAGVNALAQGVETWAKDNNGVFPQTVEPGGDVAMLVDPWPTNPYTGDPMADSESPGDYSYELTANNECILIGHLPGGRRIRVECRTE